MKHPVPSAGSLRHPSPGAGLSNRQDMGSVGVINEPNKGFLFKAASMARLRAVVGIGTMLNTRKILIVDDDSELREALTEQLSLHEEFDAVAAKNGSEGVQAVKVAQIDLVIMDVGLPDIDGHDAVRILRKNGFKAPIIMLTGHDTDADTILSLESGANDYVTKPFRFAVLLARIRAQLRQHEASDDVVLTIGPYTFRPSSKLLLNPKGMPRVRAWVASGCNLDQPVEVMGPAFRVAGALLGIGKAGVGEA